MFLFQQSCARAAVMDALVPQACHVLGIGLDQLRTFVAPAEACVTCLTWRLGLIMRRRPADTSLVSENRLSPNRKVASLQLVGAARNGATSERCEP